MAAPVMGLVPTSPPITDVGTLLIPVPDRSANGAAVPRGTVGGETAAIGCTRSVINMSAVRATGPTREAVIRKLESLRGFRSSLRRSDKTFCDTTVSLRLEIARRHRAEVRTK